LPHRNPVLASLAGLKGQGSRKLKILISSSFWTKSEILDKMQKHDPYSIFEVSY
jgi:hypothetical protein